MPRGKRAGVFIIAVRKDENQSSESGRDIIANALKIQGYPRRAPAHTLTIYTCER
jgi:hypothetical protein